MSIIRPETSVVVVEDDPASADVLQRRLQANGMTVSVGRTGADGLQLIRESHPDLVLLDVGLPDTDGYDVCLQVKSDGATADIPVIFLSARGDVFDKVRGLSCGAADYLTKPFHPAELLARVDAVLAQSRRVRSPRLVKPAETTRVGRALAVVALADPIRRERAERILGSRFDLAAADDGRSADLLVVDADAAVPPTAPTVQTDELLAGPAILRIAPADLVALHRRARVLARMAGASMASHLQDRPQRRARPHRRPRGPRAAARPRCRRCGERARGTRHGVRVPRPVDAGPQRAGRRPGGRDRAAAGPG